MSRSRRPMSVAVLTAVALTTGGAASGCSADRSVASATGHPTAEASRTAAAPSPTTASPAAPSSTVAPSTVAPLAVPTPTVSTPTVRPPTVPPSVAPVVVLDPGHNGGNAAHPEVINAQVPDGTGGTKACNTVGTQTVAGYSEHAFTWDVALRTRDLLTARGVRVVLTRPDDAGVGPCVDARARVAEQAGAVAFVGIHGDGAAPGGRGFHVITSGLQPAGPAGAARSAALAADVRDAMTAVEPVSTYLGRAGLVSRTDLAGLNLNRAPAVYVECGNMKNATDAALMSSPAGRQQIAGRLAAGLLSFLGR